MKSVEWSYESINGDDALCSLKDLKLENEWTTVRNRKNMRLYKAKASNFPKKKVTKRQQQRLRMFINKAWMDMHRDWKYTVLAKTSSGHAPLIGWDMGLPKATNTPYRFCKMWINHDQFLDTVKLSWEKELQGDPLYVLNVENDGITVELNQAKQQATMAQKNEEELWKQKSRVQWLESGDRNTTYFLAMAKIRRTKSLIHRIKSKDGVILEDQIFSEPKSKLFLGTMKTEKKERIKELFGLKVGIYPENYLGIPIMQGRAAKSTIWPLIKMINKRANGWVGSMLSIQGRVVLVKSVLRRLSVYNIGVYKWPMSGNTNIRKACVVGWNKTCKPRKEGGIDIRSLKEVNLSLLMKLAWNFLNGQDDCSKLMRAKFSTKSGNRINSTQGSSVWAGIRRVVTEVEQRSGWIIGDEKDIDLWRDNWGHQLPLKELINSDSIPWNCLKAKVSSIIQDGHWRVHSDMETILQRLNIDLSTIQIRCGQLDRRIWKPDIHGRFLVKSAFQEIRNKGPLCWLSKYVYRQAIHPRLSLWG
ncbi:hypothetical protein GIB67_012265 [Kingdonia uniflora]|uniref:Reverse transcriptase n=1 Tax=Kingdonia uniflora TaxID=39325 RepID=A0A7J7LFV4_9MAGN|nr:hypothetical protein GIB67_012265 [Kingdonia uniflora]